MPDYAEVYRELDEHVIYVFIGPHDASLRVLLPLVRETDEASSWCC